MDVSRGRLGAGCPGGHWRQRFFRPPRLGTTLEELARKFPQGRLTAPERKRYDVLAVLVHQARERRATLAAIGEVIGRPRTRVSELAQRGAELVDRHG